MKWILWHYLTRANTVVMLAALAILALAAIGFITHPQRHGVNAGFGPEWDCKPQAFGDAVCLKKN